MASRLHCCLVAWLVLAALGPAQAGPAPQPDEPARYEAARLEYEVGHYQAAFDAMAQLADQGHCEATRTARQMLRHGRALYGIAFSVSTARHARWTGRADCTASTPGPR